MRVLHARREVGALVDHVGFGEAGLDVADLPWSSSKMLCTGSRTNGSSEPCSCGAPSAMASSGSNTAGSTSYSTTDPAAALLGGADRVGQHGHHPLADEAHDVVEDVGVVGVDEVVGVDRGREALTRHVLPGVDACTPGTASAADLSIETIRAWACGECSTLRCSMPSISVSIVNSARPVTTSVGRGRADAAPTAWPGAAVLDRGNTVDRILDGAITGAAAEVALQRAGQVLASARR